MESADREDAIDSLRGGPPTLDYAARPTADDPRISLVSINALRAFAAIWVLLHHANFVFWQSPDRERSADAVVRFCYQTFGLGWLGVPLFFVISGFCIHLPYARRDRVNAREFAVRRATRIWPPYAAAIVAGLFFQLCKGNHSASLFSQFAANLAFLFPRRGPIGDDNLVFWSIVVEVQLYAIYLVIRSLPYSARALVGWTIAFVAFGVAYHLAVEQWPLPAMIDRVAKPRFFAPARMGEWLMGAIVAERLVNRPPRADRASIDAIFVVGGIALVVASRVVTAALGLEQQALETFASAGFALALAGLVRRERRGGWRGQRWIASVGDRSYSLYLFHFLALNVAMYVATRYVLAPGGPPLPGSGRWLIVIACGVALAVVVTEIVYRLVERPSHRLARRWGRSVAV